MKTKLLAAAFAALVCAEAFVGLRTIGKASDIVETGTELRLPIKQVKKLDFEKFDPTEFSPRIRADFTAVNKRKFQDCRNAPATRRKEQGASRLTSIFRQAQSACRGCVRARF